MNQLRGSVFPGKEIRVGPKLGNHTHRIEEVEISLLERGTEFINASPKLGRIRSARIVIFLFTIDIRGINSIDTLSSSTPSFCVFLFCLRSGATFLSLHSIILGALTLLSQILDSTKSKRRERVPVQKKKELHLASLNQFHASFCVWLYLSGQKMSEKMATRAVLRWFHLEWLVCHTSTSSPRSTRRW